MRSFIESYVFLLQKILQKIVQSYGKFVILRNKKLIYKVIKPVFLSKHGETEVYIQS